MNTVDKLGLLFSLERLKNEDDETYKSRIYQISQIGYKPDLYSIWKSISIQCGLEIYPAIQIQSEEEFICELGYEYFSIETQDKFGRVFIGEDSITLSKIVDLLGKLSFDYTCFSDLNTPIRNLIKTANYKQDVAIMIGKNLLLNKRIIKNSIVFEDTTNFNNEVSDILSIKNAGDYFVDYENGYIEGYSYRNEGQYLKFKYIDSPFLIETSELSLTPVNNLFKFGITKNTEKIIKLLLSNNIWDI